MGKQPIKDSFSSLSLRARMLGIPREIYVPIIRDFLNLKKHNGKDYAVKRFKDIKQIALLSLANPYDRPIIPKEIRIKKSNPRELSGPYKWLINQMVNQHLRGKSIKKYLTFLNIYSTQALTQKEALSAKELKKFCSVIELELSDEENAYISDWFSSTNLNLLKQRLKPLIGKENYWKLLKDIDPVKSIMVYSDTVKPEYEKQLYFDAFQFANSPTGFSIIAMFHDIIGDAMPAIDFSSNTYLHNRMERTIKYGGSFIDDKIIYGEISYIQDLGMKRRYVCNFRKVYEHIFKDMGRRLYSVVGDLPWDVTFSEEKCFPAIQQHLKEGKTAYAVDLSEATDRFPWTVQYTLLNSLFGGPRMKRFLKLFDHILSNGYASLPKGGLTSWNRGQPMGAYPSFAMFTLAHGLVLFILNGMKWDNDFFVHGDDIVILNPDLYMSYISWLKGTGTKYNPFKTVVSDQFTEINSKIITKDRVMDSPKWKKATGKNVTDLMKSWGPEIVSEVYRTPKNKALVLFAASLPEPWGIGYNPYGLSLDMRFSLVNQLLEESPRVLMKTEGSMRDRVYRRYHRSDGKIDTLYLGALLRDLELADEYDQYLSRQYPEVLSLFTNFNYKNVNSDVTLFKRAFRDDSISDHDPDNHWPKLIKETWEDRNKPVHYRMSHLHQRIRELMVSAKQELPDQYKLISELYCMN